MFCLPGLPSRKGRFHDMGLETNSAPFRNDAFSISSSDGIIRSSHELLTDSQLWNDLFGVEQAISPTDTVGEVGQCTKDIDSVQKDIEENGSRKDKTNNLTTLRKNSKTLELRLKVLEARVSKLKRDMEEGKTSSLFRNRF